MSNDFSQYYKEDDVDESLAGRNQVKGRPFWTPISGGDKWHVSRVRIMPAPADKSDGKFYTWVPLHSYLPGSSQPVLCPNKHADLPCPACQMSNEYRRAGNEKAAIKFAPTWRGLVNVLVLDDKGKVTPDTRPLWWGMPKRTLEDLLAKVEELKANGEDARITSPRYGRDVFVRRTGKDDRTRYEIAPGGAAAPWTKDMAEFLPKMNSLEIEQCYDLLPAGRIQGLLSSAPASNGWGTPEPDPDAMFGAADGDVMDGVFSEVPQLPAAAIEVDDNPFAAPPSGEIADDDDLPFEVDEPVAAAAPASNRVAEARAKLQSKIASKA